MTEISKDLTINIGGWQDGIGQSVLDNFSDMLGVNINDNPGSVSSNFKFNKVIENITPQTFTVITDRVVTSTPIAYRGAEDYIAVTLTTTGTLPTGLDTATTYYLIKTATNTYKLQTTLKGSGYASITAGTGSGVHTITPVTPSRITGSTKNGQGRIFYLDNTGKVWFGDSSGVGQLYLLAGNTLTGSSGNGIIYYKGYILVFRNSYISALNDIQSITDTLTWTNDFITKQASASFNVPFISVNDDSIYFSDGIPTAGSYYQVSMLEEVVGKVFDPTDATTFSYAAGVITLPNDNGKGEATSIKEMSQYIVIGTNSNKIFFWDKKSPSFTSFITLQDEGIKGIEIVGDTGYAFVGINGYMYVFNTSSSSRIKVVPEQISNQYYGNIEINFTATSTYQKELLFAIKIGVNCYLMSYNLETKKLVKKNISSFGEALSSTNTVTTTQNGYISYILVSIDNIIIGSSYYNFTTSAFTYALESLLYNPSLLSGIYTYYVYDNYEANIITGLITYGDIYNKRTTKELFVSLLRPLETSQGIKISYRRDDISSWTLLKTIDYTTYGAFKEIKLPAPITDIIDLQIKIELDGLNLTSPRLKTVRLIP